MTTVEESVTETREDIPLKKGKQSTSWYCCHEDCFSGSKFLNVAFGVLTFVITVALLVQIYYGVSQVVPHGSVATDSLTCSAIGTTILKEGGNAIDAAIATAFCLAVATPHVTGLDAEGQLIIYNHRMRLLPNVIDFSGPTFASERLPRLVLGLAYVHQQFGSLAWKNLVRPAAELAERGYLISKMLVEAIKKAKAEDIYGHLEAGQILDHENLSKTLSNIADMSEDELYGYINNINNPLSQALKLTFNNYDIYMPNILHSIGPFVANTLQEIEKYNFTKEDTVKPEYVYRLAETIQIMYKEKNISTTFHEGTSSNVAVMDLSDTYVSLVTGMYELFGSAKMTEHGYVLDVKNRDKPCTRVPVLITDAGLICGKRIAFGASDLTVATQLVTTLIIAKEKASESIEAPRFYIFDNGTIGIEDSHLPSFSDDVVQYLRSLSPLMKTPEPYSSSNIVEKFKDELTSHSDSRGGGIASRF